MGINPPGKLTGKPTSRLDGTEIGACVFCRRGVFPHQLHGRAPRPYIGLAHRSVDDCPELAETAEAIGPCDRGCYGKNLDFDCPVHGGMRGAK